MTNLQKSIELARKHEELFGIRKREECCVAACQEMAEWKDEQFNMIIEKIIDLFDKYPSNAVFSKNNVIEMFETLKIAMEE